MIRINLLPFRAARKRENVRQQVVVFLLAVLIAGGVLAYVTYYFNDKISTLQKEIEYTQKQVAHYNAIAKEAEKLKKELDILRRKLDVIKNLNQSRSASFRIFNVLTDMVIEKRMWLTEIESKDKELPKPPPSAPAKPGAATAAPELPASAPIEIVIKIQGIALDNKTVADFMTRMEGQGMFSEVRLVTLQQEKIRQGSNREDISLKRFLVTGIARPIPPEPAPEKKSGPAPSTGAAPANDNDQAKGVEKQ